MQHGIAGGDRKDMSLPCGAHSAVTLISNSGEEGLFPACAHAEHTGHGGFGKNLGEESAVRSNAYGRVMYQLVDLKKGRRFIKMSTILSFQLSEYYQTISCTVCVYVKMLEFCLKILLPDSCEPPEENVKNC